MSVPDEMQVPAECLASLCQGRAADLKVIFKNMHSLFLFLRYAEPQYHKKSLPCKTPPDFFCWKLNNIAVFLLEYHSISRHFVIEVHHLGCLVWRSRLKLDTGLDTGMLYDIRWYDRNSSLTSLLSIPSSTLSMTELIQTFPQLCCCWPSGVWTAAATAASENVR